MPNTTVRAVRVNDELWDTAAQLADTRGETLSEVIRRGLHDYIDNDGNDLRGASEKVAKLLARARGLDDAALELRTALKRK